MNITDLRNAVNGIDFDREKQRQMMLEIRAKKRPHRYTGVLRAAAAVAVCILTVGILSVPVRAVVNSLVQERMEEMPREEVEGLAEQIQSQRTEADSYTREYTEEEKERRAKLYEQYMNGVFPTGELPQVDSEAEAADYEFCYLTTTSAFYLPMDRALTDEEILEQIDFEKKRDYALQEQHAEEIEERKAAEREQVREVVASGGVTEEQAVEAAQGYLEQIYGLTGDGMELNHYYEDEGPAMEMYHFANAYYCVNWSDMGNRRYYYFYIDAMDGTLTYFSYSGEIEESIAAKPTAAEAPGKTAHIREQAEAFLTERLDIQETYEEVKSYYLVNEEEGSVSRVADVLFVKADGTARRVSCVWSGEVSEYLVTTKEEYEAYIQALAHTREKYQERETGKELTIRVVGVKD